MRGDVSSDPIDIYNDVLVLIKCKSNVVTYYSLQRKQFIILKGVEESC